MLLEGTRVVADVPINGRKQSMVFSHDQVQVMADAAYQHTLKELAREGKLDRDPQVVERVRRIASRVIAQAVALKSEAAHWNWEVHVATTDRLNAYCMAGGKIMVGASFLDSRRYTDGEIAALLGHEVAHALAEHVREELSEVRRLDPAYARLSVEDVIALLNWDLSVSFKLAPLSRLQELEADDIGIFLAAKAGYDPQSLVRFYRKLALQDAGHSYFDTHGSANQREKAVEGFAAYAESVYAASVAQGQPPEYVFH